MTDNRPSAALLFPQVAADTNSLSGSVYTGAATYSFIEAVESYGPQQPYGALVAHMVEKLDKAAHANGSANGRGLLDGLMGGGGGGRFGGGGGGMMPSFLTMGAMLLGGGMLMGGGGGGLFGGGGRSLVQTPQLSCDKPFDLNAPLML